MTMKRKPEPYRPLARSNILADFLHENTKSIGRTVVSLVVALAVGQLVGFWFPEGTGAPLETLFKAVTVVAVYLVLYWLRGPYVVEQRQLEHAVEAIRQRDKAIESYEAAIADRVPQAVVDRLEELRREVVVEVFNKPPEDEAEVGEWWERFKEWQQRVLDTMDGHFTDPTKSMFETIGNLDRLGAYGFSAEHKKYLGIVSWKMDELRGIIREHTRATPLESHFHGDDGW